MALCVGVEAPFDPLEPTEQQPKRGPKALNPMTVSNAKVSGKSVHCGKNLLNCDQGWDAGKSQTQHQTRGEQRRSFDMKNFQIDVAPTTSKMSLPIAVKLHLPVTKNTHLLTNIPQRFGRESVEGETTSTANKPQRFGRSWEAMPTCAGCVGESRNPKARQNQRNLLCWRLLRTLARAKLWKTGLHWFGEFESNLEEMETEIKRLQDVM
ncbi:pro-FMRFamide-related neuropeptide VF isoform 1-T1 [Syngnathus typhle]